MCGRNMVISLRIFRLYPMFRGSFFNNNRSFVEYHLQRMPSWFLVIDNSGHGMQRVHQRIIFLQHGSDFKLRMCPMWPRNFVFCCWVHLVFLMSIWHLFHNDRSNLNTFLPTLWSWIVVLS